MQGLTLSKAELVSKLQKSEEEKDVLAEKLDAVGSAYVYQISK